MITPSQIIYFALIYIILRDEEFAVRLKEKAPNSLIKEGDPKAPK